MLRELVEPLRFGQRSDAPQCDVGVQFPGDLCEPVGVDRGMIQRAGDDRPVACKGGPPRALQERALDARDDSAVSCGFAADRDRGARLMHWLQPAAADAVQFDASRHRDLHRARRVDEEIVVGEG
jgi:hypothetical protein